MMPPSVETSGRLSIQLSDEALKELKNLAKRKGISMREVMRRALAVYDYVADEGNAVSLIKDDGSTETLLIP